MTSAAGAIATKSPPPQRSQWLTIPFHNKGAQSKDLPINEIEINWDAPWNKKQWATIKQNYQNSPCFSQYAPVVESLFERHDQLLADLTIESTIAPAAELSIKDTQFVRSSSLHAAGQKAERLISVLQKVGAIHYISVPSARDYIQPELFEETDNTLEYQVYKYPEHAQHYPPFDDQVSILDLLFNEGPLRVRLHMEKFPPVKIPFNKPGFVGNEHDLLLEALSRGHISGDGHFTKQCHELLERIVGVRKALLTTSCTHALEIAAILLDLRPGDEVIAPSFTFVSTVNAFALHGATIRFADICTDTLNIDPAHVERLITPRTRAIIPVHYAGIPCDMPSLLRLAEKHQLTIIEDAAHAFMGKSNGKALGAFGAMSTLSFHETKNFSCGEGGALLINNDQFIERAEIIREKGTNRSRFFRGQVDKYTWVDLGSSYLPSDILAALLFAQLCAREQIQSARRAIWEFYHSHLHDWAQTHGIRQPVVPDDCEQPFHMYYLLLPTLDARQAFIAHLRRQGIWSVFHYVPLHNSPMGQKLGGKEGDCPVTESVSDRLVRLPMYKDLTLQEVDEVVTAVRMFHP